MLNALIIAVCVGLAGLLLYPPLARATLWRATITPLASIIGSGFLVLGPILNESYGAWAPLVMLGLCLMAYLLGAAIRANMARLAETSGARAPMEERLETLASWALAFAYVISVAYYLNLLGSFAVSLTELDDRFHARLVTTGVFVLILMVGTFRGFGALEALEQVSVGLKLAIIGGLIFGMGWFVAERAGEGALVLNPMTVGPWQGLTLAMGLLVTVQGFETSRYLGQDYDAATRIRSMRLAQWLSTAIYMAYILLLSYAFVPGTMELTETAIIDLMGIVAPVLPVLLIAAAIGAQFSAAVADTGGSGGLLAELTGGRLSARAGYALLVAVGLALTWVSDVFQIISHASRAFALYYALQALIAALGARAAGQRGKAMAFGLLACVALAMALFGAPVE